LNEFSNKIDTKVDIYKFWSMVISRKTGLKTMTLFDSSTTKDTLQGQVKKRPEFRDENGESFDLLSLLRIQ
jgi:hypothetical protein